MKDKFIRIISPLQLLIVCILDICVIGFGVYAIQKLIEAPRANTIFFAICEVIAIIVGILVTKEVIANGVYFRDDEMEFTGLDNNNLFEYELIESIETKKDTKASLVKNFIDRQSTVIIKMKDGNEVSVMLGLTTKGTLDKIAKEIESHIGIINS